MNCHEAKNHLFADSNGAPDARRPAALDEHLAHCASCRRIGENLAAALTVWRHENARAPLPDVEREWHAVRRKIRGGAEAGGVTTPARPRRNLISWIALPIGAAAALALALYVGSGGNEPASPTRVPAPQIARADSVEVPGKASTVVYVDDKSGWLIVWADAKQI